MRERREEGKREGKDEGIGKKDEKRMGVRDEGGGVCRRRKTKPQTRELYPP